LEGLRVVELGFWVAGPAAAGILADWGADVIKIEPPTGDPMRGMFHSAAGVDVPINPPFELDNRGKRSLALNLSTAAGHDVADGLLARADVFVTNVRANALARMGLDHERLLRLNPRLVYCAVTGYGVDGPDRDRPAYDIGAYWSRAAIAASLRPADGEPPQQRGGMGDHTTAISAVSAICAALLARERTGRGQFVSTSLLRTGAYVLGWDVSIRLRFGKIEPPYDRFHVPNPLVNCYRSGDDQWFWLLGLQGDRHWPDVVRAIDKPALLSDPRFKNIRARRDNNVACVEVLDAAFKTRAMREWRAIFDRENVWWSPVQTVEQLIEDPQARAAGMFVRAPVVDGTADMVANPADFAGTPWRPTSMAPELGQHTEEILLELGYDWDRIAALRDGGALG
jgi:crotonobetainyl-CoA:carnitine CoA-transferase CaiB-like acyl-CoA transferase